MFKIDKDRFYVMSFGRDCMGNCTGWSVRDSTKWRQTEWPVVKDFVGDIYKPKEREQARKNAYALAAKLNREEIQNLKNLRGKS